MKKILILISIPLIVFFYTSKGQTCITLQPNATTGQDAWIVSSNPNSANPNYTEFASVPWTCGGSNCVIRSLLKFDLSGIPANAIITSAKLSLYATPTTPLNGNLTNPMFGTNASYLQRITASWSPATVNWNNQPATTTVNQVTLPTSTSSNQNYIDIDVKNLVTDMLVNGNNGFLLRAVDETPFRSMIFASSNHPNASAHPKLEICYTVPSSGCLTLQPNASTGQDAWIVSSNPTFTNPNYTEFASVPWTCGGSSCIIRSLLKFDLSGIPVGATVTSAKLSLYATPTAPLNGNLTSPMFGTNASYLQRITASWSPATVNWNNQPATTTVNQVTLPTSTSSNQNYIDIDVKNLVTDMLVNGNNGFLLRAVDETPFRSMIFASSNHPTASAHPKLEVCYNFIPAGVNNENLSKFKLTVWPNPAVQNKIQLSYTLEKTEKVRITVFDINGKQVLNEHIFNSVAGENNITFNHDLISGVYFLKVLIGKQILNTKVIIQ